MYRIAHILAYFLNGTGHWPDYIDWYMASCRANGTIDFFIFTDDHSLEKWEETPNIHIVYMSFDECVKRIHEKMGPVNITKPYKLCDMKPVYGHIFSEWIEGYDFWAFGDCDLIFGDLRKTFTDAFLDQYDWFQILGNLEIIRNTEEVGQYYLLKRPEWSKHREFIWENIIREEENQAFDEQNGLPMILRENEKKIYWNRENFVNIYQPEKGYKKMIDNTVQHNTLFQYWKWENGSIYHINGLTGKKKEYLYIHFSNRKLKTIPYEEQKELYITVNSELKGSIRRKDTFAGGDFVKVYTKKIREYIKWHLTHLHGKDRSEL